VSHPDYSQVNDSRPLRWLVVKETGNNSPDAAFARRQGGAFHHEAQR
jgi:hypothetical protein